MRQGGVGRVEGVWVEGGREEWVGWREWGLKEAGWSVYGGG